MVFSIVHIHSKEHALGQCDKWHIFKERQRFSHEIPKDPSLGEPCPPQVKNHCSKTNYSRYLYLDSKDVTVYPA